MTSLFDLSGKRALVTGASKGIGLASARLLSQLGAQVTVSARGEADLVRAASEIGARAIVADVSHAAEIERLVQEAGEIDILVSNAGGPPTGLPSLVDDEGWQRGFELTFMSTVRLSRALVGGMRARGWGRVITITSLTVGRPSLGLPVSNALRAGVTNFARSLALEVARDGVTVNTVAPGYTATERLQEVFKSPEDAERVMSRIPAARFGSADEVASAVAYLSTAGAAYITGQEILVDGGWSI
ncbi:SDR family oxidoreductase [Deinococcus peraridilitoris]|uniref:Short-chain alcohol dehydrogenase like protein n=1 Tax=Deinococcus peraridilitoris (strain DSM 19664 / LMG 22246 / CIP 109416 / KR-200) TaxID=937777 RepID=K9ZYK1_DEIPD|nr:SDR family oxidoreductase [Deinococcus peraridilitoris]AFZ65835.1 dehydrogenase of unknown specificity, short-chain alcohol dehydrogenase like protein [Deinococcus peraridilitoris DSM 19664]